MLPFAPYIHILFVYPFIVPLHIKSCMELLLLLVEHTHLAMHVRYHIYQYPDKLGSYSPSKV